MSSTTIVCLLGVAAAGLCACGMYRHERVWERMKLTEITLGELGTVRVPAEWHTTAVEADLKGSGTSGTTSSLDLRLDR